MGIIKLSAVITQTVSESVGCMAPVSINIRIIMRYDNTSINFVSIGATVKLVINGKAFDSIERQSDGESKFYVSDPDGSIMNKVIEERGGVTVSITYKDNEKIIDNVRILGHVYKTKKV